MFKKDDPWYLHAGLYLVIAVLVFILIKVAVLDPSDIVEREKYNKNEARLRMKNLKEVQLLYFKKNKKFTNDLNELIKFYNTDSSIDSIKNAVDSMTNKSANPFINLSNGTLVADSLLRTPGSQQFFILSVDSTKSLDTVITTAGRFVRIDTTIKKGTRFKIEDPDGYGTIGDLENEALKTAVSWE